MLLLIGLAAVAGVYGFQKLKKPAPDENDSQIQVAKPSQSAGDGKPSAPKSDEVELADNAKAAVLAGDFGKLNSMAEEMRKKNSRVARGWPSLNIFYESVTGGLYELETKFGGGNVDSQFQKWTEANNKSVTPWIAQTHYRIDQAWRARGSGPASSVRPSQWAIYKNQLSKAQSALNEVEKSGGDADPESFVLKIRLGKAFGAPREEMDKVVEQAMKTCPDYDHVYIEMAVYLLPRWEGQPGEMEKFAEFVREKLPSPTGDIVYVRIFQAVANYEGGQTLISEGRFPYEKLHTAFDALIKKYDSRAAKVAFCHCACLARNAPDAARMFAETGEWSQGEFLHLFGGVNRMNAFRNWAKGKGPDPDWRSPLDQCILAGDYDGVTSAIAHGADVNASTPDGELPLSVALAAREHDIGMALLKAGANPRLPLEDGTIPPFYAVQMDDPEILQLMLDTGIPLNDPVTTRKWTMLHSAAASDSSSVTALLLSRPGIHVEPELPDGQTPLHIASAHNSVNVLKLLLKAGADVNSPCNNKCTPLHYAASSGSLEAARILLAAGADPNLRSTWNLSALDEAEREFQEPIAQILRPVTNKPGS